MFAKTEETDLESLDLGEGYYQCPKCFLVFNKANKEPVKSRHPPYVFLCPECGTEECIKTWEVFVSQRR